MSAERYRRRGARHARNSCCGPVGIDVEYRRLAEDFSGYCQGPVNSHRSTLHDTPCGCSGSTNHIQLWLLFWTGSIRTKAWLAPVVWLGVSCTYVAELVGVLAGDHRRGRHDGRSRRGRRESVARRSLAHGHAFASQRNLHYVSNRKDHFRLLAQKHSCDCVVDRLRVLLYTRTEASL